MIPPSWWTRCPSCQKQLPQARTPHEQTDLERRIGYWRADTSPGLWADVNGWRMRRRKLRPYLSSDLIERRIWHKEMSRSRFCMTQDGWLLWTYIFNFFVILNLQRSFIEFIKHIVLKNSFLDMLKINQYVFIFIISFKKTLNMTKHKCRICK